MSFADRVIKWKEAEVALSDVEKSGDPAALAAEFVHFGPEKEDQLVSYPRASCLYDDCMRMRVLGKIHKATYRQWTSFRDRVTYGIGGALHYWVQNTPDVLGNRRVGWWKCRGCGNVVFFGPPPTRRCPKCGALKAALVYHEHAFKIEKPLFMTGHADMFVAVKPTVFRVLEIKSITGEMFPTLAAPLIQHLWQIQSYMWACSLDGAGLPIVVDPTVGYIMYISKKHSAKDLPVKVFPVERDDAMLNRIKAKLRLFKRGYKNYPKDLPPLASDCKRTNFDCWRAKTCPVLKQCRGAKE